MLVKIYSLLNGLSVLENVKVIRIKSKDYNLLIMKDYVPIIGEIEGDFEVETDKETKELDMIFFWENLMTDFEKNVYDKARGLNISLDYNDVKDIADKVLNSKTLNKELVDEIKEYDNDMELM